MNYYVEQDIDLCALKLHFNSVSVCVLTIYKAPAGSVNYYIHKTDVILHTLYTAALRCVVT
jgi:hypothetical protein